MRIHRVHIVFTCVVRRLYRFPSGYDIKCVCRNMSCGSNSPGQRDVVFLFFSSFPPPPPYHSLLYPKILLTLVYYTQFESCLFCVIVVSSLHPGSPPPLSVGFPETSLRKRIFRMSETRASAPTTIIIIKNNVYSLTRCAKAWHETGRILFLNFQIPKRLYTPVHQ